MNFHKLDLNLLVALDALLEERHVGRAAERMHVSQPTMSVALAKLRAHYGDELLIRDGRGLAVTPFAAGLRPMLRQFMAETRALSQAGAELDLTHSERRFIVIMSHHLAQLYIPGLLRRTKAIAPLTTLTCLDVSEGAIRMFNEGEADLLVMSKGAWLTGGDRSWLDRQPNELLFDDQPVCLAWAENDAVTDPMTLAQVGFFGHVITTYAGADLRSPAERPISRFFGAEIKVVAEAPAAAVAGALVGTPYVAIMNGRLARFEAARHPLKIVKLPAELSRPRVLHLFWPRRASADPAVAWLRGLLHEEVDSFDHQPGLSGADGSR
jgi:LysR family nod box-dependent transcriptional activator